LRGYAGGSASVQAEGETVGQVFADLVGRYPAMSGQVVTGEGVLHKFVNVYVNDDDIRYLDRLDTKISAGDVVTILPAVAGG
jgi:MoaD family protein